MNVLNISKMVSKSQIVKYLLFISVALLKPVLNVKVNAAIREVVS